MFDSGAAKKGILSGNQLKIIALVAMTCDHVGSQLLPQFPVLRIIGRLSFPIFAYMIAEGCTYTKDRKRYLLTMAGLGLLCQIVYFVTARSLYMCVLVTFSLSIVLCYLADRVRENAEALDWVLVLLGFDVIWVICVALPGWLPGTDFWIDYGIWGVMLPVFVFLGRTKTEKLLLFAAGLVILSMDLGDIQWFGLAAVPLMAFYSGSRGKRKLKRLFYIYYPLHLVVIYLISIIL